MTPEKIIAAKLLALCLFGGVVVPWLMCDARRWTRRS